MNGNYYPVEVENPGKKPAPKKRKIISKSKVMMIAVIILAAIVLASVTVYIIDKILNPELIKIFVEPSLDYEHMYYAGEELFRVFIKTDETVENMKCGLIDKYGNIVMPVVYDYIDYFNGGVASVWQDGKWGLIDKTCNFIVPIIYDSIGNFHEGLAAAGKEGKRGYIDKAGNVVVDFIYDGGFNFSGGLAVVEMNSKKGVINENGEEVIPLIYDAVLYDEAEFRDGIVIIGKGDHEIGSVKWGVIDKTGNVIIPFEYDNIDYAGDGTFKVCKDGRFGFINKNGESFFIEIGEYGWISHYFNENLIVVQIENKYGCIDMTGNIVIPLIYDSISSFNNGLSIARKDGNMGCINTSGEIVIPFEYLRIRDYDNGMLMVQKSYLNGNGETYLKSGIININGGVVIPLIYDQAYPVYENGLIRVGDGGKYGLIDYAGEIVIPLIYDNIVMFEYDDRIIEAQKGSKWGLINKKGDVILPFEYDEIHEDYIDGSGFIYVKKDGLYGIMEIKK